MTSRTVWGGRYAVFDELASGGMASVFLACRLLPGESARVVAVKKMFESFAKRPELVTMFLDEAHVAARIRHPNVVTTWEFIRVPDSLAIVMEFVLGASLMDLQEIMFDRGTVAPLKVTAAIVRDALLGLHAAHEAKDEHGQPFGLVHRDVSPHNILVGKDGVAKVIDFGIAKAAGRLQVTDVGVMKGKMAYMAPEQIRVEDVDRRVDVYAAGVVLWEALTGKGLFQGPQEMAQFALRSAGTITVEPPSSVNPLLSSKLDAVVLRALSVDPKKRFATTVEMAEALEGALPTATPLEVANWVMGLAGSRIRELEAKRNEVEATYAAGELADLGARASMPGSDAQPRSSSASLPSANVAPPAETLTFDVPDLVPQPRPSKPAVTPREAPPASVRKPPAPAAPSFDESFDASSPSDLKLDVVMPPISRSRMSSPSLDVDARPASSRERSRSSVRRGGHGGRVVVILGVLVVVLGVALAQLGPGFLMTEVVAGAARRGVVLVVDRVEPRSNGVALLGATASLASMDGATMKAAEVDLAVDWQGNVQKVSVRGYELTLAGSALQLSARFAAWRKAQRVPLSCEASAGHLVWPDALVPGAATEGLDVSLVAGAKGEGSLAIEVPSLTITVPRGSFGPWRASLESTPDETKVDIALDRAKPDAPPSLTLVDRPSLGTVVTLTIPRTKPDLAGIPSAFVGMPGDPEIEALVEGQVLPDGDRVTVHATVTLFGVSGEVLGPEGPADVVMEGSVGGAPFRTSSVESGSLTIGHSKTTLFGEVTLDHDSLRIEVDRPSRKGPPPPPFVFDTRDWAHPATSDTSSRRPATNAVAPVVGSRRH